MELICASIFGLIIGSFLNVCIYRVPRKLSIVSPARSHCPSCNYQLSATDNIPVISWCLLGAKCRKCKAPISGEYPLVELLSGLAAAASLIYFGLTITGIIIYALSACLIVITFIDLHFKIIPNVISYPGIAFGLLLGAYSQFTGSLAEPLTQNTLDSLIGMYAGGGFFWLIGEAYYLATRTVGLGGGDVKLMGMTGAILGWHSVAPTIFMGSLLGSIVGIGMVMFKGGGRRTEIPFGPWLSIGTILFIFTDIPFFRV